MKDINEETLQIGDRVVCSEFTAINRIKSVGIFVGNIIYMDGKRVAVKGNGKRSNISIIRASDHIMKLND